MRAGGASEEEERGRLGADGGARAAVPSDPSGVADRLHELQQRLEALAEHVQRGVSTGPGGDAAGARIIIVRTPPARPELPPSATERPVAPVEAPDRHDQRRSGFERRGGSRERRRRRGRRRRLRRDPRPVGLRVERRRCAQDRRSGRGDRRLGHDRRASRPVERRASRKRSMPRIVLAVALQVAFWAAVGAALVLHH